MHALSLILEFLWVGWTVVEAYPQPSLGYRPSYPSGGRPHSPVWGPPASNYPHSPRLPSQRPPPTYGFPRSYYLNPPAAPYYPVASYRPPRLSRPVLNLPRTLAISAPPAIHAVPRRPIPWYRPRNQAFRVPLTRPPPKGLSVHPGAYSLLGAPQQSSPVGHSRNPSESYGNTEKISRPRLYTSPMSKNPRRISLFQLNELQTGNPLISNGPNTSYGDEFPREEPSTLATDIDVVESQTNVSSKQTRKLVYGNDIDNVDNDPESSLEGGCGEYMSCRTSYHCALLGGKPTYVPCGMSPGHYCCDLIVTSEMINSSSNSTVKNDPQCGWNRERTSRIIGGHNTEFGEIPWQAFVKVEGLRCGGALLSRTHVVTAAHCVVGRKESKIEVLLGELVLKRMVEEMPHEHRRVAQIIIHPDYENLNVDSFDVAILVLDRPVDYRANIMPICLPEPEQSFTGALATVSGWGRVYADHESRANHLQSVQVPVIGNRLCRKWLRSRGKYAGINSDHLCAGYEGGGQDSCRGDSGGPLTYQRRGRWYLVGIVSAGFSCGKPRQPGIYHRVSHSSEWISKNVFQ